MIILLDSGPLGLITNPKVSAQSRACRQWLVEHLSQGNRILVPEIITRHLSLFADARVWTDIPV